MTATVYPRGEKLASCLDSARGTITKGSIVTNRIRYNVLDPIGDNLPLLDGVTDVFPEDGAPAQCVNRVSQFSNSTNFIREFRGSRVNDISTHSLGPIAQFSRANARLSAHADPRRVAFEWLLPQLKPEYSPDESNLQ